MDPRLNHLPVEEIVSMTTDVFTDPEETAEEWVDVRMTNPEEGEWDVDIVVVDGQVNYVDLRIKPELLAGFLECLIDDISDERGNSLLTEMVERNNTDRSADTHEE